MRIKNRDLLVKILSAIGELPQGLLYEHTATGNPATFKTNVKKAVAMEIPFTPVQDLNGYDYPWTGGATPNIFDADNADWKTGYFIASDGTETANTSYSYAQAYTKVKPSTTYCVQINKTVSSALSCSIPCYTSEKGFIIREVPLSGVSGTGLFSASFTTPATCEYIRISIPINSTNIQIEEGSTASSYTPYSNICPITGFTGCDIIVSPTLDAQDGTTYSISWQTEAETVYGGVLTVNKDGTGSLVVTNKEFIFDGDETFTANVGTPEVFAVGSTIGGKNTYIGGVVIANQLWQGVVSSSNAAYGRINIVNSAGYNADRVNFAIPNITNLSDMLQYLAQNNLQFIAYLNNPISYTLTAEQIKTILGTNNIWTTTNGTNTIKYMKRG